MRQQYDLSKEQAQRLSAAEEATHGGDYVDTEKGTIRFPNPVDDAWNALAAELGFDVETVQFPDELPEDSFTAEATEEAPCP